VTDIKIVTSCSGRYRGSSACCCACGCGHLVVFDVLLCLRLWTSGVLRNVDRPPCSIQRWCSDLALPTCRKWPLTSSSLAVCVLQLWPATPKLSATSLTDWQGHGSMSRCLCGSSQLNGQPLQTVRRKNVCLILAYVQTLPTFAATHQQPFPVPPYWENSACGEINRYMWWMCGRLVTLQCNNWIALHIVIICCLTFVASAGLLIEHRRISDWALKIRIPEPASQCNILCIIYHPCVFVSQSNTCRLCSSVIFISSRW
jgi:hypothetical protein